MEPEPHGAAILTSWSRSRAKMERLHNTGTGTGMYGTGTRPSVRYDLQSLYSVLIHWYVFI